MDNLHIALAANIQKFRKKAGFTQEALARHLGVTFQSVSKWENAKSAPDIFFLPIMAELFGCYVDELFSREVIIEKHYDHCSEFPWPDDTIIRGIVCEGRKILQKNDSLADKFTFEITGDTKSVVSNCNVIVNGSVTGGCTSKDSITVSGSVVGECVCKGDIIVGGNQQGECTCKGNMSCKEHFGDIVANSVNVKGNVRAGKIEGSVICKTMDLAPPSVV